MRFRRLSTEELFSLETEFKQFLVIHELYDEEWRLLAEKEPEKTEQIILQFSELVLEKVYKQISFLVHFSSTMVSFFDMRNNPLKAYHIKCSEGLSIQNEEELEHVLSVYFNQLHFYRGEKQLHQEKADEVFELIRKGCESCEEAYFLKYTQLFEGI